jgi:predicted  nucleic acid-binding Zn-ribbon protein
MLPGQITPQNEHTIHVDCHRCGNGFEIGFAPMECPKCGSTVQRPVPKAPPPDPLAERFRLAVERAKGNF